MISMVYLVACVRTPMNSNRQINSTRTRTLTSLSLSSKLVNCVVRKKTIYLMKKTQPLALCSTHTFVTPRRRRRCRCLNQTNFVVPCCASYILLCLSIFLDEYQ